jgi:hypothetical protein
VRHAIRGRIRCRRVAGRLLPERPLLRPERPPRRPLYVEHARRLCRVPTSRAVALAWLKLRRTRSNYDGPAASYTETRASSQAAMQRRERIACAATPCDRPSAIFRAYINKARISEMGNMQKPTCDGSMSTGACPPLVGPGHECYCTCPMKGWFEIAYKDTKSGGGVDEPKIQCGQSLKGERADQWETCDSAGAKCRLRQKIKNTMIGLAVLTVAVLIGTWIMHRHKHNKGGGEANAQHEG